MKIEQNLNYEEAKNSTSKYEYVLGRELSRVYLCRTADVQINWDEVVEIRLFNETSELRIDENHSAVRISDSDENMESGSLMDISYPLEHNGYFGTKLTVREYLGYDDDGQLFVKTSRLKGWEE